MSIAKSNMFRSSGTCVRCGRKGIPVHVICLKKPVENEVELEFPEICEDKCFQEWSEIWEKEVKGHLKPIGYYIFMEFLKNNEKVAFT
jgi:hypothetical protein